MNKSYSILENIAENSIYAKGVSRITTEYCSRIFEKYMKKGSVLELGPADGVMTEYLFDRWKEDYTVIDGAQKFVNDLKKRFPEIKAKTTFFEDYKPNRKFDNIILGHVLEHVDNPVKILESCKNWLNDDGIILCAIPNADSLHRQAAVIMGLMNSTHDFSEKDRRHGHKKIFNYTEFGALFSKAGLSVIKRGGYWLKPLSDSQIEKDWSDDIIHAYLKLGEKYAEIAGEIYIVAKK